MTSSDRPITSIEEDTWRMERRQVFITEAMTVQLKAPDGGFLIGVVIDTKVAGQLGAVKGA